MPSVKTAISLPEPLFHRAETVAHALQISRSQLAATAIDEFVKRYERQALIEAINRAYEEDPPTSDEKELLQGIRKKQRNARETLVAFRAHLATVLIAGATLMAGGILAIVACT